MNAIAFSYDTRSSQDAPIPNGTDSPRPSAPSTTIRKSPGSDGRKSVKSPTPPVMVPLYRMRPDSSTTANASPSSALGAVNRFGRSRLEPAWLASTGWAGAGSGGGVHEHPVG